jgi:hypothetical protein
MRISKSAITATGLLILTVAISTSLPITKNVYAADTCVADSYCNDIPCASEMPPVPVGTGTCTDDPRYPHCCLRPTYADRCEELTKESWEGAPSPLAIICPMVRYLNIIVYASAAVFVIMIFAGAIKFSLAQGDPKAIQGAKGSLTWAVIGFIVIIGVFTMLTIFKNVLGLKDNPIADPVGAINRNLMDLLNRFGITNY